MEPTSMQLSALHLRAPCLTVQKPIQGPSCSTTSQWQSWEFYCERNGANCFHHMRECLVLQNAQLIALEIVNPKGKVSWPQPPPILLPSRTSGINTNRCPRVQIGITGNHPDRPACTNCNGYRNPEDRCLILRPDLAAPGWLSTGALQRAVFS